MLGVFNSNLTTKFVQLQYFLSQSIGADTRLCAPLVKKLGKHDPRSPWNSALAV